MKKTLPLLIKNVLLPLLFTLPGILSNREVNDLQITSHQTPGTLYTTSTLDTDSRWNQAPKSSQQQRWNLDSSTINHSSDDSALAIQSGEEDVEEVRGRTQVNTQQEDSTQRNQLKINAQQEDSTQRNQLSFSTRQEDQTQRNQLKFNTRPEDQTQRNQLKINTHQEDSTQKNQLLEEDNGGKEEEAEQSSQTTTVHMPTYFSYGTTRRANYRDRVNSNRNFNGRINQEAEMVNGRRNNVNRNNTSFVNDKRSKTLEDQEYGRISPRVVVDGRSNNDEDHVEDSTSVVNSRSNNNYDVEDSRRSTSRTNDYKGNDNTVTVPPTSNQPTMTYSSDFLKLTSPKLSTFGERVNSTDVNYFTNTQLLPSTTDRLPESQTSIKYSTNADQNGGRGGRILTGRRKVNESATTQGDSDRYLERIHQQIQASTFSPFSTTSYHDANKNLEYKKKPIKKETEGDMVLASGGGKGAEKLHVAKTETQKTTEILDKIHKDLVKNKENVMNMTQKPIEVLDERYSTIIDTLSKGSGNVPQSIISQKNVTINNEPGTNLLENENAGSKENNEKRETKEKDVDETKSRGDVIPVIIKNSVVGEGVSDLLNKTVNFRYPDDVKPNNESLFSSGTNGGEFLQSKTDEKSGDKNLETNERIIPQVDQVLSGREAEAEKDEQEIKKKIYNLKKPLLPTSGGKVEDGFEVMLKNGSSSDIIKDDVTYFSSSVPSLELYKTATHEGNRSKLVEQDETKTEEENGTKMNELRETRIISSTSRITSSFSSNKLGPTIQQQYTTFASNNLENNIITTSSPLVYGFTSTTPRVNHFFSMRTSTTVQSQPATSAGENLIKQISSFNPRKRPAVTYYQTPAPQLSTKKSPEMFGAEESSIETEGASSFTPGHHSSSTSMRTDTVRKIVPWSTRLQKTTLLPESTTMDYSDESTSTTFSYKASSVASPDWSLASSEVSAGLPTEKTFSTTFSLPTATFVTSETPWTPLSRTTSRSVDETSSVTDSSGQASPASKVVPGRSTKPALDASVFPGRATVTYLDDTTIVPTSSSQSFSITTAESPTSSVVDIFENTTTDASPSVNSSIRWGTASSGVDSTEKNTTSASEPSVNSSFSWGTTSSGLDLSDSAKEHATSTLEPSVNSSIRWGTTTDTANSSNDPEEPKLTTSKYPHPESTSTWETGNTTTDLINNKTKVEPSSSPSDDLETNKSDDMVDSTTWSSYQDGNSTEDLQFGDVGGDSGRWKSTTTSEETTVSAAGESGENESIRPVIMSRIPDNLTSTSGMPPLSRPVVTSKMHENLTSTSVIPPITRQNFIPNSISKQISTSVPNSTLNTNITSTTKTPETVEDSFETDEEEIQTTTSVSTEGGEYEQEDDDKTTTKPDKDNRIVPKGNEEEITTQRNNFIMKISTTESPLSTHLWTTDSEAETTTAGGVSSKLNETSITSTPSTVSVESVKTTPMQRPIKPVTIEPDPPTTNPQYIMGLSLLIKGSTLQEICDAQSSLKKAIVFLFRNTTGRILYEDQIVFPNLTPEECKGAKAFKNGYHNIDMMLFDENGNFDDELNSEFRKLWENNGLRTNIAIHDVYLILRPQEDVQTSGMTIAVIVIACIGLTCLLLFFILMMILRKRQKKFNYGQRCTPVSLDDYSLDNISVYNSIRRKNARRASKRSYGNPAFDDPSAPSNQMNFAALSHFCGNRTAMDDEFDEIPKFSAKMDELPPGAETRNRYANVIPLPETRVQLAVREGDDPVTGYINANYVKGPKGPAKFYIACQAPMQSTVNDFWRMIWEQQSKLILMLTDLHENGVEKCFDYLPPSEVLDCHRLFGDYQVTLKKREVREKYVISHLQLKNLDSNLWREVTHLWYTSWPHQGTPSEGASMIAYLIEARAFMRNSNGPHIVHCSPGVGRTGTVLAIDLCIREFETCRMVDVPKTVSGLRRDRAGCVQTKDQYAFIYMVLNVYGTKLTGGALDSI